MKKSALQTLTRRGGKLLFGVLLSAAALQANGQQKITSTISSGHDDMEEIIATGALDDASSDLELVTEGAGVQIIGLRFTNIDIPQGAYITKAHIQFTCDETGSGSTLLTLQGEASDNPATFATTSGSVSSRPLGTASVNWNVDPWNIIQEKGAAQKTPNLAPVIQEIVNRPGWQAKNALVVLITGSGKRVAESFEGGGTTDAAKIEIEYTMPVQKSFTISSSSNDAEESLANGGIDLSSSDLELSTDGSDVQVAAMRFTGVSIPQGAMVTNAYIQFTCDETSSVQTDLTITGEAADNSAAITSTSYAITSRTPTPASVNWPNVPAWNTAQERSTDQRTPDISAIVQEIVNRPGWTSGNAMGIAISGTGSRVAESYDGANSSSGGHSPNQAPTLVVEYVTVAPPKAPIGKLPVPNNAVWSYLDNGTDQGTAWKDSTFDAGTWAFGAAQLGYGDGDETTVLSFGGDGNNKHITTYFRHVLNVTPADMAAMDSVTIGLMADDGAVVYINGKEVYRSNLPSGSINYKTEALSAIGGGDESAYTYFNLPKSDLVAGLNYIAAEIHQDRPNSSDISFGLTMVPFKADIKLFGAGESWMYSDEGKNLGYEWAGLNYNDSKWENGNAVLGFGNGDEATALNAGSIAADKPITYYFRKSFTVADASAASALKINLKRDDGAVVYLNGKEIFRSNMRPGLVNYMTRAASYVEGDEEDMWITGYVSASALKNGKNVIAVEVHQDAPTSTDLRFDMELVIPAKPGALYTGTHMTCDPLATDKIGCFTSVKPGPQQQLFIYPKTTHTFQELMKAGRDEYTATGKKIPGGHDFTGFIPENGSSTKGWLSVNHENTPGGVTIMPMHYDEAQGIWIVDSLNEVDFGPVASTIRNCSGGVTPWGTIITSEETYNQGDNNGDGYTDAGWQVEIDPRTHQIVDHDGNGQPDKLWALGRMSHENIAVANDSITTYQAEDGGTGCVYKFIADNKTDLSTGKLYVLKGDAGKGTGSWIQVPNTTQAERNTTRDLAGALGGTNWGGPEDVEIGPDGYIYFTAKGPGVVYRFKDDGMSVSELEVWVASVPYSIEHESGIDNEPYGGGNDNLAFDGEGNLWVLQDGTRNHIWVVKNDHTPANPHVELFGTTPAGSEPTGITFTPDFRFMFLSFQGPSGSNSASEKDAAGNEVVYNNSNTVVIARKQYLGKGTMKPVVELGNDTTICEGGQVVLTANVTDATPVWNDRSSSNNLVVTESGKYYVTVTANNGQQVSDTINIIVSALPEPHLGNDTSVCYKCDITLDAGAGYASYKWSTGATTRTIKVSQEGNYSVTVKNAAGCEGFDAINVYKLTNSIEEVNGAFSLKAYPNPFTTETNVQLDLKKAGMLKLEVYDLTGRKVATLAQGSYTAGRHTFKFNAPAGKGAQVYMLRTDVNGQTGVLRIIGQ